jgi:GDP-mannose 6-dehydrogenase
MPFRIAVLGLGYVGCVSAACLAQLGYEVVGVDTHIYKVECVNEGRAPFFEPGLDDIVSQTVQSGKLRATASLAEVIDSVDFAFLCVGTPSQKNGNLATDQLRRVSAEIAELIRSRNRQLIIAVRSTVFPGTCDEVVGAAFHGSAAAVKVVSNPEFLREGSAVRDFKEPSLLIVGSDDEAAARRIADLYAPLAVAPRLVSLRTAEIIKYACNSFHAVKIAFANEIGAICAALNIDGQEVMSTLCCDKKLNISPAYLEPGFPFGGSCLPKDLRALTYRAGHLDLKLPLLEAALPSNQEHLRRAMDAVLDVGPRRLGIIGLAFKENTDDLRESAVVSLLEQLIGKGRDVRVYDPNIQIDAIYGSNRNFILQQIPHISRLMDASLADTLAWSEHVVIAQKLSPAVADAIAASGLPVLDLTRG